MYDAVPLQVLASGTTDGVHGGLTTTASGCTVASPGAGGTAGTYTITLDPGVPGDIACEPAASRIFIQIIGGAANSNVQVAKTSPTVFTLTTQVGAGAAADMAFDFVIFKDPNFA